MPTVRPLRHYPLAGSQVTLALALPNATRRFLLAQEAALVFNLSCISWA